MPTASCRARGKSGGLASPNLARAVSSCRLPVIGVGAVLAAEVLVQQLARDRAGIGAQIHRVERDPRDELQDDGIPGRAHCALAPGERTVAGHQDCRHVTRILAVEAAPYHETCIFLIVLNNLVGREIVGYRNGAEEVVRVCRAKKGNGSASLSPYRWELRVGMGHAADIGKRLV